MANACEWHPAPAKTAAKAPVSIDQRFSTQALPTTPDRYRLVWGRFCPWATQSAIAIDLLHLPISKGVIYPYRRGTLTDDWVFGATDDVLDPVLKIARVSSAYQAALPDFAGRATVLTTTGAVVNNDADVLLNELTTQWGDTSLIPAGQATALTAFDQDLLAHVNKAPGNILSATSQADYLTQAKDFFAQLSRLNARLATQDYLFATLSQADIRLFVTLVRFDLVYAQQNKLNYRQLQDYPALWAYAKRLYRLPAFHDNTDFEAIFAHFYQISDLPVTSFERVTPYNDRQAAWNA